MAEAVLILSNVLRFVGGVQPIPSQAFKRIIMLLKSKEIKKLGNLNGHQSGVVYGSGGVSPTLPAFTHGYALGWLLVKTNDKDKTGNEKGLD